MNEEMYRFTIDSEICMLKRIPELAEIAPYTFGNGEKIVFKPGYTFLDMQRDHPTWDAQAAAEGCNRLLELVKRGTPVLHHLENTEAKLLYFPTENTSANDRPWILLAAGGGYFGVCSLVESIPAAAYLNKLGFDVFCLNYRCGSWKLMPKPMDDFANAVRYIRGCAKKYNLSSERYVVGGFSAGGHLAGMWGTNRGFSFYNLPAPECIWLNYPMVSAELDAMGWVSAFIVRKLMFGVFSTKRKIAEWALDKQIMDNYPSVYLVMAKDDDTIPQKLYERLKESLVNHSVRFQIRHVKTGGHGYGLGNGTEAEGWIEEAIEFWKKETGGKL